MMTRKEVINALKEIKDRAWGWHINEQVLGIDYDKFIEIMDAVLSFLDPVSREQVEKVWKGCEWCNGDHSNNGEISAYAEVECEGCDAGDDCPNAHSSEDPCYGLVDRALPVNFCPACGAPMTDEAVGIMLERLRKMNEE